MPEKQYTFTVNLLAGGCAGTSVDVCLYPLDTLKTRFQVCRTAHHDIIVLQISPPSPTHHNVDVLPISPPLPPDTFVREYVHKLMNK